jgi:hypothetical protein
MKTRYVDHYLADLADMARILETDFAALQGRLALWSRDGYPTRSDAPAGRSGIGDPTATAVLASDPVRRDRERLAELIVQAHDLMREADAIRATYMNAVNTASRHNNSLTKCANINGCPDDMWSVKAGRCLACYEYRRTTDRDRPSRR